VALRIVVIGLGPRGREWVRTVREHPGHEVVAGVEPDPAAAAAARAEGFLAVHASLADALAAGGADAAIVATAPHRHAEDARAAIAAGLHVLVEKPFAPSVRDAQAVVAAASAAGRSVVVGQNYRTMRAWRTVRRFVADGTLGRLQHVELRYFRDAHVVNDGLRRLSSVALWETGVHYLDLLRVLAGAPCVSASARIADVPWTSGLAGTSLDASLAFASGVQATCSVKYGSGGHHWFERGQETYARLMGERGTLHVLHRWLVWCPRDGWPRLVGRGRRDRTEEAGLLDQWAEAIVTGRPADCSGEDNLHTIAIAEACERSARTGQAVDPTALLDAHEVDG
jgi:predicted dehydrogenase